MSGEWPNPLTSLAYHGVLGDIVQTIEPFETEADPAAILRPDLDVVRNAIGVDVADFRRRRRRAPPQLVRGHRGPHSEGPEGRQPWDGAAHLRDGRSGLVPRLHHLWRIEVVKG